MAYLVFSTHKGQEIGRRRLDRAITIGRSSECDVSLHDIQLSRRHCRLERTRQGWMVTDLGSKNGTVIDGRVVIHHLLRPGEVIEIGRVRVTFRAGKLAPAEERKEKLTRPSRPADPFNASAGTVAGFKYEPPAGERSFENFPTPKPVLTDSGRFVAEGALPKNSAALASADRETRQPSGDSTIAAAAVHRSARPKTPNGDAVATSPPVMPPPPPVPLAGPPRAPIRLRLKMFVHSLQRGIRRPLARWAALLT